jgi:hypothetical protein
VTRDPVARDGEGQVVAAVLPLGPDAARHPPGRRVVEEQRLDHALKQVDQVIVAQHVGQLVRQQRFEMCRRQFRQHRGREQDERLHDPDYQRRIDPGRLQQPHRPADAEPFAQAFRDPHD